MRDAFDDALSAVATVAEATGRPVSIKAFSDNIVLSLEIRGDSEDELLAIIKSVAALQSRLVMRGFFVRGAIAIGLHYMDDEIVFGEAILEAYDQESNVALNPRVILAPSAVSSLAKHREKYEEREEQAPQADVLLKDTDGKYFVNYLAFLTAPPGRSCPGEDDMRQHKRRVSYELQSKIARPRIWTKYIWAAKFHDFWCATWGLEIMIDPKHLNAGPSHL
jgi:hypothetical protein